MLPPYISVLYKWRMTVDVIAPSGKVYTDRIMKVNGDNVETAQLMLLKRLQQKGLEIISIRKAFPFAVCHAFNYQTLRDVPRALYKRFSLPQIAGN